MSNLSWEVLAKAGVDPGFLEDLKRQVGETSNRHCAYCGLLTTCTFYGRRWLCSACAKAELGEPHE
jgi:hypothetical protein